MNRTLRLVLLAIAALAIVAPLALAAGGSSTPTKTPKTKVTGGTTTVKPSDATTKFLSDNGVTVTPIAPATAADGNLVFPIRRGRVNTDTFQGRLFHKGGVKFSKGERSLRVRRLEIVSHRKRAVLRGVVRGLHCQKVTRKHHRARHVCRHARHHRVVLAILTDLKKSEDGKSVTVTVKISRFTARVVNRLAHKVVVKPGYVLGTATIAPTTGS